MAIRAHQDPLELRRGEMKLSGPAWFVLAVVATLPVFWFGFEGLAQEWARPEFRFKAIVPILSFLLMLQVMRSVPATLEPIGTRWLGVLGIGGALMLALLGNLIQIDDFVFIAMIAWVAGLVVTCFGLRRGLAFWAPVASLFLMLPLPRFVVAPIHRFLEGVASELGIGLLRLIGVPARVEGQILDFGVHQLRLAEATAGLVNFLPVMLVLFFFATVYRGPLWSRLMPLILAAPVMVVMTSVRIAILGVAINRSGSAAAEQVLRLTDDWVFFGACLAMLLGLVITAQRLAGHRQSIRGRLDFDLTGLGGQVGRVLTVRPTGALVTAAVMTVVISTAFAIGPSRPAAEIERESFRLFPPDVAGWIGSATAIGPGPASVLNADDYVLIDFHHREERAPVNLWSAYYYAQEGDRGGIHSPQDCLPIDGWNIVSFRPVDIRLKGTRAGSVMLNRAVIRRDEATALVYYWFEGRGRRLSSERLARLLVKVDGLVKGRTDGALVRYVTVILPDETQAEADARLQRLVADTIDQLPRFIPE